MDLEKRVYNYELMMTNGKILKVNLCDAAYKAIWLGNIHGMFRDIFSFLEINVNNIVAMRYVGDTEMDEDEYQQYLFSIWL